MGIHFPGRGGAVDGGGPLLLRAIVVVIPLLLVIAGDVETNPGPEGTYSSEEGSNAVQKFI